MEVLPQSTQKTQRKINIAADFADEREIKRTHLPERFCLRNLSPQAALSADACGFFSADSDFMDGRVVLPWVAPHEAKPDRGSLIGAGFNIHKANPQADQTAPVRFSFVWSDPGQHDS